jgi:adenylate cyclase
MAQTPTRTNRLREAARRFDSRPGLVAGAELIRRMLPGDADYGDALSTQDGRFPQHLGRMVADLRLERPSAARELGLGALQAWQALSEAQRRGRGTVDVAILFTDLVGFSSWALEAGDEAAIRLLRVVCAAEDEAVSRHQGTIVKRLGDGVMAVFGGARESVEAAFDLQRRLGEVEVEGHTPELRAGAHLGRPRKVGGDYLGVDVNVAARVVEAARGGEVLVSDRLMGALAPTAFEFGHRRPLEAAGAPKDLSVCIVRPRAA